MPPVCCRCNASGRCKNCSCKKANSECANCLPRRLGQCTNIGNGLPVPNSTKILSPTEPTSHQGTESDSLPQEHSVAQHQLTTITETGNLTSPVEDIHGNSAIEDLPCFQLSSAPNFRWGEKDGESFSHSINQCYNEIVHWKRNLFKVPSGKAGKMFTSELTRLFRAYADQSAIESIALTAAMVMPSLLLQKPHAKSKAKDHTIALERRLQMWTDGNIDHLLSEGRTIQRQCARTRRNVSKEPEQSARKICQANDGGENKSCTSPDC